VHNVSIRAESEAPKVYDSLLFSGIFTWSLRAKEQQWTILTAKILKVCRLFSVSWTCFAEPQRAP